MTATHPSAADKRTERDRRKIEPGTYQRPVKATLRVVLDNGEAWDATGADLAEFGLLDRHAAYMAFADAYREALTGAGLIGDGGGEARCDLTDAELNPMRYLVEIALAMPRLLEHPDHEAWAEVANLERRLRNTRGGT